ncbi:MAG TPA: hypothetical protein PKB06_08105 [Actinotalea sp.]|nr:hypothetical protein [Actinotalea sp.]
MLAETVARLEREALAELDSSLNGAALCRVAGDALRPAKHWEGRSAALAEVRRSLRRSTSPPSEVVSEVRRHRLERFGELSGPAWRAYTAAGLEVLVQLAEPGTLDPGGADSAVP